MDKWVINLRQNLKEDAHIGFSVNQKSGKVEPTHRINGAYKRNAPEALWTMDRSRNFEARKREIQ